MSRTVSVRQRLVICCSFVQWTVSKVGDHAVLYVTAPPDQPEAVAPIPALFGATP